VRDFDPAYVRFGSLAAEMIGTMRPPMSASRRKPTGKHRGFVVLHPSARKVVPREFSRAGGAVDFRMRRTGPRRARMGNNAN
jgi:hypothetical protein